MSFSFRSAFEIPTGALGDRIGPRRVLTRIVLWWSAFTSLTGAVTNYSLLLVVRFIAPEEWLTIWSKRYPTAKYDEQHDRLIARRGLLGAAEFVQIGRWKDAAGTDARWKSGVASVAYDMWNTASLELPQCPRGDNVEDFLRGWSGRQYADRSSPSGKKRFGLSRSTTLLYFISGGRYPIFDARVRRAIGRLTDSSVPNTAQWYVGSYRRLFSELAARCMTEEMRLVDKALFSYGAKTLPFVT